MNTYAYHVRHKNGWGTGFGPRPTHCHTCAKELPPQEEGKGSVGYGCGKSEPVVANWFSDMPALKSGESYERSPAVCYECCAKDDLARMKEHGKIALYFCYTQTADKGFSDVHVSNWPASLTFPVYHFHVGRHNFAFKRYDVYFRVPEDGFVWHGVQYGDNTQIVHCKRTKERVR